MAKHRVDDQWWSYRLIPASIILRAVAATFDFVVILLFVGSFYWFLRGFDDIALRYLDATQRGTLRAGLVEQYLTKILGLTYLSFLVYGILCEASPWSGTLGKRLMQIRVVDEFGERLSLTTAIVRNLAKSISLAPMGVGFLAACWSPGGQAWHDRAARSFVAKG